MDLPPIITAQIRPLGELCQQNGVDRLYVFGSVLTTVFAPQTSDLDFLVEMGEMSAMDRGESLMSLWDGLESLFGRKVDLLTDQPIKNPILKKNVNRTKLLVYDREREKIFD